MFKNTVGIFVALIAFNTSQASAQTTEDKCDTAVMAQKVKECVKTQKLKQASCASLIAAQCVAPYTPEKTPIEIRVYRPTEYNCFSDMITRVGTVYAEDTAEERFNRCSELADKEAFTDVVFVNTSLDDTCITSTDYAPPGQIILSQCVSAGR